MKILLFPYTPPRMRPHIIKDDGFYVKLFATESSRNRPVAALCGYYYADLLQLKKRRQQPLSLPLRGLAEGGVG